MAGFPEVLCEGRGERLNGPVAVGEGWPMWRLKAGRVKQGLLTVRQSSQTGLVTHPECVGEGGMMGDPRTVMGRHLGSGGLPLGPRAQAPAEPGTCGADAVLTQPEPEPGPGCPESQWGLL